MLLHEWLLGGSLRLLSAHPMAMRGTAAVREACPLHAMSFCSACDDGFRLTNATGTGKALASEMRLYTDMIRENIMCIAHVGVF